MVSTPVTTVAYGQQQSHREIYAVAHRHCVIEKWIIFTLVETKKMFSRVNKYMNLMILALINKWFGLVYPKLNTYSGSTQITLTNIRLQIISTATHIYIHYYLKQKKTHHKHFDIHDKILTYFFIILICMCEYICWYVYNEKCLITWKFAHASNKEDNTIFFKILISIG